VKRLMQGAFALVTVVLLLALAGAAAGSEPAGYYIVLMAEEPAVSYEGGVAGLAATKPGKGKKIDPLDRKVSDYVRHLESSHDAVLARVGGAEKLYDYGYVLNGFAAQLTDAQVAVLEKTPGVTSIEAAEEWHVDTMTTPAFLGLSQPGGLWSQLGGPQTGTNAANAGGAGEGVVVGIIDTGIWPEHPSVSDRVNGKLMYKNLTDFHGKCSPAEIVTDGSFDANLCNKKLVAARFFLETREAIQGPVTAPDFRSPRDSNGHGTHVATTAAGNFGIQPTGDTSGFGKISGMAPRARIAMYKVCWPSCFTPDSAAAFDQAVADGVDVINFSISGSTSALTGFVMDATRRAAEAGVFVSMSAGNTGPGDSTVAHVAPWVTTVGNSTHPRSGTATVVVNGVTYTGGSLNGGVGPLPAIYAGEAAAAGATASEARLCLLGADRTPPSAQPTLDPAKVAGKIIVCDRGSNVLVNKAAAAKNAGAAGMILANGLGSADTVFAILHVIPSIHVDTVAGDAIRAAVIGNPAATATINPFTMITIDAPFIAAGSSRGPNAGTGSLLKPDVTAPGTDILAGYSPVPAGRLFDIISGTSMSSPHVAGSAALLIHRHPDWTPMMIKSALMTTGSDILGTFTDNTTASAEARRTFAQGAGHIRPTLAADPGLVFEHGPADWARFICGAGQAACAQPLNPTDLNGASISIASFVGSQVVARTVKSVASVPVTYTASFSGLPGITPAIDAGMFTVAPGGTHTFNVTFTRTDATIGKYAAGHLTLTPSVAGRPVVRIPLIIRPVAMSAPASVELGAGNNASWTVKSGVGGTIAVTKTGLQAATTDTQTIADDPTNTFVPGGPGTFSKTLTGVPAGALVRFDLFDEDTDGNDDLDLVLTRTVGTTTTTVSASGGASSRETVSHRNTATANYTVWVHAFQTDGPDAVFTLFGWTLTADGLGTVLPATLAASPGSEHTITLTGGALTPGVRYLGEVTYNQAGTTGFPVRTLVTGKAT